MRVVDLTQSRCETRKHVKPSDRASSASVASTSNIPGSGLGLWIAKGIAEKHGGTLNLKSPLGPTEFLLTLPRNLQKSFQ